MDRRARIVVVGLSVLAAGCHPATSPPATTKPTTPVAATSKPAHPVPSPTRTAAPPTPLAAPTSVLAPVVPPAPTPAVVKQPALQVVATVVTGDRSGAALVRECLVRHPCTERVETTADSGLTWRVGPVLGRDSYPGFPDCGPDVVDSLAAADPERLYAVGSCWMSSAAWTSDDAGHSWRRLRLPSAGYLLAARPSYALVMPRPDRLGSAGLSATLLIRSGGQVERRTPLIRHDVGFSGRLVANSVGAFLPARLGDGQSWLMRTQDQGRTWQRLAAPATWCWSFDPTITVAGPRSLLSICDGPNGGPHQRLTLVRSDDAGLTWRTVVPLGNHPAGVVRAAPGVFWMYGNLADNILGARLKVSTDSGRHWRTVTAPDLTSGGTRVTSFAAHGTTVWVGAGAAGYDSQLNDGRLHVSVDGGQHWRVVRLPRR
ncbi:hypothetical protein acdb102_13840 [Acidothermaceae bacterium B102]|nr:hypothetical protein acdb102_13840 [Acidothermaceae bacterium B102]